VRRKRSRVVLAIAAVTVVALAATANAGLVGQLGVLDPVNANGGLNPVTGNLWQEGDQYRLALHTSLTRDATSTDINDYNAFVQSVAAGSTAFPDLGNGTWKVLGSTATVSARQNTNTDTNVAVPILAMDGLTVIAEDSDDMWDGWDNNGNTIRIPAGPVVYSPWLNEEGGGDTGTNHGVNCATGTNPNGTIRTPLGGATRVNWGSSNANTTGRVWVRWDSGNPASQWSFYALSDPLSIIEEGGGGGAPVVIFGEHFEDPDVPGNAERGDGWSNIDPVGWTTTGHPSYTGLADESTTTGYGFSTPDGAQASWIYGNGAMMTTPSILSAALEADTIYTLTWDAAKPSNGSDIEYIVELLAGTEVLSTKTGWATSSDMSLSDSLTFTADGSDPNLGETLAIRLMKGAGDWHYNPLFDNVQLTAAPVGGDIIPEPATLSLLGLGALLALRRRRRSR